MVAAFQRQNVAMIVRKLAQKTPNPQQRTATNRATGHFYVAGPVAWNSLPLDIRSAPTLSAFKNMPKTHLFSYSYFTD